MKHRALTLAVLAAVLLAGCLNPYTGKGPKVAVVGDSITAFSSEQISSALTGYSRSVTGTPSIDLPDGHEQLVRPAVASDPEILVVELGLNSARDGWTSADLPHLEAVLETLDDARCVVWITPSALAPSYYDNQGGGTMQARAAAFKASLVKRLPRHPNQHLADFSIDQLAHPEWFTDDHLHPTTAGKKALASFVKDSLGACT